jgi:hypothetical protein
MQMACKPELDMMKLRTEQLKAFEGRKNAKKGTKDE